MKTNSQQSELLMESVNIWTSFYRENPHRFIKDYFGIKLKRFQEILITLMFDNPNGFLLGCRGISKTWCTALFSATYCVLYPGTEILVASGVKDQARQLVRKIQKDFIRYPMFAREISTIKNSQYETLVEFKNGSTIRVVVCGESARGYRANVMILDEARLLDKATVDSVLKKTMTAPRHPGFMDLDGYEEYPLEPNKLFYLTSGWYSNHWIYTAFKDHAAGMIMGKPYFAVAFPYQLTIKERLNMREAVETEMNSSDFNEVLWIMEMEAEFWSGATGSLYSYEEVNPSRNLRYVYYPPQLSALVDDSRVKIPPKTPDEIRVGSCDIALMQSTGKANGNNDATSIWINFMKMPTAGENEEGQSRVKKKMVYSVNFEGLRVEQQALEIRRFIAWYDLDYMIVDARGIGLPIIDLLMDSIYDPATGETYCALGCCNNDDIDRRCTDKSAPKKIWAMLASADINSSCALTLREEFKKGNVLLPEAEEEFEENFSSIKGFEKVSEENKVLMKLPYINTSLAINELINLETEVKNNYVKVKEKAGFRKDRYSSLSYNIWVSNQIEKSDEMRRGQLSFEEEIMALGRAPA